MQFFKTELNALQLSSPKTKNVDTKSNLWPDVLLKSF